MYRPKSCDRFARRRCGSILVGILLLLTHVSAQSWTQRPAMPRLSISDTISMMEVPFCSSGASGDSCVWDFTHLRDSLPRDFLLATTSHDSSLYAITKVHTRYHYRWANDSLWQTGYENNRMMMRYASPVLLMTYPLTYSDTFQGAILGNGEYCHLLPTSVHGQSVTCVDGSGRLLLPHAMIDSVVRVHTTQTLCEHVGDTLLSTIEHYQWFCPQISHPLLETIAVRPMADESTLYAAAFYYQFADTLRQAVDTMVVLPVEQDSVSMVF